MLFDAGLIALAFMAAYATDRHFYKFYKLDLFPGGQLVKPLGFIHSYLPLLLLFVPLWILFMMRNGMYRSLRRQTVGEIIYRLAQAGFLTAVGFGAFAFVMKIHTVSRFFVILIFAYSGLFLAADKIGLLWFFHEIRRRGYNSRNILIVGRGPRVDKFIADIEKHEEWGFRIIGPVDIDADIPHILHHKVVDEVVFIVPHSSLERVEKSILDCEAEGVHSYVAMDLFNLTIGRLRQTDFENLPLLSIETTIGKEWQRFSKRAMDIAGSALGLVILSPLFLFTAAVLKISAPQSKIFFRQVRSGLNGRKFLCYKFRSMEKGAHAHLKELRGKNEMQGPVFKLSNDPRVTAFGKFLRKSSIDELPQLINVLFGKMSLVGPRPPLPTEVRKYEVWQRRRLSMRPGLTCLWQISGRSKISGFDEWMKLDLKYIDNWSLWLDTKILIRTIPAVLFGVGAK